MIPGVTNLPRASMTTAPAFGSGPFPSPTAAIDPLCISTNPGSYRLPVAVRIVAFRMSTGGPCGDSTNSTPVRARASDSAKGPLTEAADDASGPRARGVQEEEKKEEIESAVPSATSIRQRESIPEESIVRPDADGA